MSDPVERTEDGRHIVVNGRRWRATDPSIPASFRTQLVRELMAARRAVKHADGDEEAVAAARRRVHHAKVALGERGEAWWEPSSPDGLADRIRAAANALLSSRAPESSICPSDVARVVGSPDWRPIMPTVRSVVASMAGDGEILVTQGQNAIDDPTTASGPIRLCRPA